MFGFKVVNVTVHDLRLSVQYIELVVDVLIRFSVYQVWLLIFQSVFKELSPLGLIPLIFLNYNVFIVCNFNLIHINFIVDMSSPYCYLQWVLIIGVKSLAEFA